MNKNNEETVIFECMDSSVVMSEDFEGSKDIYYSYLCSHESRCHKMPLVSLHGLLSRPMKLFVVETQHSILGLSQTDIQRESRGSV